MKIVNITFFVILFQTGLFCQSINKDDSRLSLEPAIGSRLSSAFGLIDIQLSGLVKYSLHKYFNIASHTAISFDINRFKAFKNIDIERSITTFQKIGFGPTFNIKGSKHTFFMMAGAKYFTYKAGIINSKLKDKVETRFTTWTIDKGLLYHLQIGKKNTYFASRIYIPIFDGKWIILENTSLELGIGFKM